MLRAHLSRCTLLVTCPSAQRRSHVPWQAEYATYLKHALCCALDCNAISDRGLRGRNIDALKELVLAPACTQDLLDAVLIDDAATMGRPAAHRQTLDEDEEADTAVRGGAAIIDEDVLRHKKRSAHAPSVREHKSAPLEHISIRVRNDPTYPLPPAP